MSEILNEVIEAISAEEIQEASQNTAAFGGVTRHFVMIAFDQE